MDLVLDDEINKTEQKTLTSDGWLSKLLEAIREDLLSPPELESLLDDPMRFILDYTKDDAISTQIQYNVIRSFFFSIIETKERKQNTQKVLADFALTTLEDSLKDTSNISAVDLSQIFKNLKD